jgi:hypothetical protein
VAAVAIAAGTSGVVTGCGDEDGHSGPPSAPRLSPGERKLVLTYERRIQAHCVRLARSLIDPGAAPTPRQEKRAFAAADKLVALAARKPEAPYGPGQDLRLFVSDIAENLEGSNCDPRILERLEQGLAGLPPR